VPKSSDFKSLSFLLSVFTRETSLRVGKLLPFLLTRCGDILNGEPVTYPTITKGPVTLPLLSLSDVGKNKRLQVSPGRVDLFLEDKREIAVDVMESWFAWSIDFFLDYLRETTANVNRVACVVTRVAPDATPALTLARHLCQDRWLKGPLNRPENFELHAHKTFPLQGLFEINSWFRCKTALLGETPQSGRVVPNAIMVEQDFNSLADQEASVSTESIKTFFEVAPSEFYKVLEKYFPDEN
jgi:hypothetical protein